MAVAKEIWGSPEFSPVPAGLYTRLSREDGDHMESDSIKNQQKLLTDYIKDHPELAVAEIYADDGYTGTNFNRPGFQKMIGDIQAGKVRCVIVKDLSRFGRDYIEAGRYLERWFPANGVRFIAVTDNIDSAKGAYDMMMPMKNLFNAQYAKDISVKVKSAFAAKQKRGEFIGAFASYGYLKDPQNKNRLIIDPPAAEVVQRIFTLFESGMGKIKIAKLLNSEGIPCPSEYKKLMGEKYHNSNRLEQTNYWTYATIHRILQNEMYIGNMEQSRDVRTQLHGQAKRKDKSDWIIIEGTHEAIISRDQWDRVQKTLTSNAKTLDFESNVSPFAGFLKCGDCGRAMVKTRWDKRLHYSCGSYKRYGPTACTKHSISHDALEKVVLEDLNLIIANVQNIAQLAEQCSDRVRKPASGQNEKQRLQAALARIQRLKQGAYEDYKDGILSKEDYLRYRQDYEAQERKLNEQLERMAAVDKAADPMDMPWVRNLLQLGRLTELDRATMAETVSEIRVFEESHIEITYRFAEEYKALLEG